MSGSAYTEDLPKTPQDYLKNELHPKVKRMAIQASFSKRMFFTLRAMAFVGSVLLPILISINKEDKHLQTITIIISIIVSLSIALEEALKFKEKYIKMEGLVNLVNKLKSDFISGANEFANLTDQQKIAKFTELSGSVMLNSKNSLLEAFNNLAAPVKK